MMILRPRRQFLRGFLIAACLCALGPALGGCASGGISNFLTRPDVNLTNTNYAAADMLLQQAQNRLSQNTVIALGALTDLNVPGSTAPFGKIISGQVGARFVQLGYNVNMPDDIGTVSAGDMPASPATPVLKAPLAGSPAGQGNVQAMITGHYARSGDKVLINLRVVDMGSSRILGAYDYTVPMSNEVYEMTQPPAPPPSGNPEEKGLFGL